jgi:hypothetical protein
MTYTYVRAHESVRVHLLKILFSFWFPFRTPILQPLCQKTCVSSKAQLRSALLFASSKDLRTCFFLWEVCIPLRITHSRYAILDCLILSPKRSRSHPTVYPLTLLPPQVQHPLHLAQEPKHTLESLLWCVASGKEHTSISISDISWNPPKIQHRIIGSIR